MLGHPLKRGYLLIPFESNSDVILNENIIKNKLDILNDSTVSTSILEFEQKPPKQVNFYPLSSIEDLFSASLQEIFNANLKIKKCEYCDYMFIPYEKRADIKYCEKIWEENNGKTCGQLAKLENQRLK